MWGKFSCILYSEFLVDSNSFLQIGCQIEKGKLKHDTVSPQPGETKDISSLKVCRLCLLRHVLLEACHIYINNRVHTRDIHILRVWVHQVSNTL